MNTKFLTLRDALRRQLSAIKLRDWLPSRGNLLFTLLVVCCLVGTSRAWAAPQGALAQSGTSTGTIPYQGRLNNASGNPLTGTYVISFALYAAATGGLLLWQETWTGPNSVTVNKGLFNVMLGSITSLPQSLFTSNSSLWLGITVGTDNEMTPRVQLASVPYAILAQTVPDGSITTAKLADGAVKQAKAPSLIASANMLNERIYFGTETISVTGTQTVLRKTITITPACTSILGVVITPQYNTYPDVIATKGLPWDLGRFTAFFVRDNGGSWSDGLIQQFDWMAICGG